MPVTAIVGGQYGSEGKGAVVAALADRFDVAVRTGGPNAGHSLWHDGRVYKMRSIPCTWINPNCQLVLGAGAVIDMEVLEAEVDLTGRTPMIDERATIISHNDRDWEAKSPLTAMGSTLEGVGSARIRKIQRDVDAESVLARDVVPASAGTDTVHYLWAKLNRGANVLLEGTQGSGLSLHHGLWPWVTSTDTNVSQLLADAGIAPTWLEHTLLVVRTYPIRVGGPSGPMPGGEIEFSDLGIATPERTTVTNKIRRISGWDAEVVERAVMLNQPCGIVLTFTDYLDPGVRGAVNPFIIAASPPVVEFVAALEKGTRVPIVMAGTGGERFEMVSMWPCKHGENWGPKQ